MLEGIASGPIIVGAYTSQDGVCPMLAAHRAGGRTSLIAFARAWDRFAFRDSGKARARRATERELRVLKTHLEASLLDDDTPGSSLATVQRDHLELRRRRQQAEASATSPRPGDPDRSAGPAARPGDPDRSAELADRSGWSWTRLFRRYDDYELALQRLDAAPRDAELPPEPRGQDPGGPEPRSGDLLLTS